MISFVPFEPGHFQAMKLQDAQSYLSTFVGNPAYIAPLRERGLAWSAIAGDRVIGSAGVMQQWPGRGIAWAILGRIDTALFSAISQRARQIIAEAHAAGFTRIEATVLVGWPPAKRWVEALGFELEGYLRHYGPDGADHLMYASVRP